jgi:hypothetical protein
MRQPHRPEHEVEYSWEDRGTRVVPSCDTHLQSDLRLVQRFGLTPGRAPALALRSPVVRVRRIAVSGHCKAFFPSVERRETATRRWQLFFYLSKGGSHARDRQRVQAAQRRRVARDH